MGTTAGAVRSSAHGAGPSIRSRAASTREDGLRVDMTLVPLIVNSDYGFLLDLVGRERLLAASVTPRGVARAFVAAGPRRAALRKLSFCPPSRGSAKTARSGGWGITCRLARGGREYFERIRETDSMETFLDECSSSRWGSASRSTVPGRRELHRRDAHVPRRDRPRDGTDSTAHGGREYVGMRFVSDIGFGETPTLFYVWCRGLVFSFSRRVIERAIDRAGTERLTVDLSDRGVSLGAGRCVNSRTSMARHAAKDQLLARSWGNLAILNEWKRLARRTPSASTRSSGGPAGVPPGRGVRVERRAPDHGVHGLRPPAAPKRACCRRRWTPWRPSIWGWPSSASRSRRARRRRTVAVRRTFVDGQGLRPLKRAPR